MKYVNFTHTSLCYSPALRTIQKLSLNIAVVKLVLSFEAILLRLPDVAESTETALALLRLACVNSRFPSLLTARDALRREKSTTQRQKFHTDAVKSVRNPVRSDDWSKE